MIINVNTKIAVVLKHHSKALDAIISISPKFEKLRNPLLRKVMAGRTSLAMAAKFGGCSVADFYQKLEPLGFEIDKTTKAIEEERKPVPPFITALTKEQLIELDVRPVIVSGSDPLTTIIGKVKTVQPGQVLKIINTFEPTPLILMLEKKGFETYVDIINDSYIETYLYKTEKISSEETKPEKQVTNDWENVLQNFGDKIEKIDVRHLEMPQPMISILEALDHLPSGVALYVYHKRIPVFLLPELAQRNFEYRIKEIQDGEVHLLIFKTKCFHQ
jgi:uncharacterized protein (DUF2249 family)